MTSDEIRNLPAGRELDALVAEHVMCWVRCTDSRHQQAFFFPEVPVGWVLATGVPLPLRAISAIF